MATYPSHGQVIRSSDPWMTGIQIDRAVNGSARGRTFYTAKKRRWTVTHVLNRTDAASFETFVDTYGSTVNTFTWAATGTTYNVLIAGVTSKPIANGHTEFTVQLEQQ